MTNGPAAIHGIFSINWNSAFVWNPDSIVKDTRKFTSVTARVTFRSTLLLSLGMNSSSRTPSIGRNVVRLSTLLMNSCSFIQSANDLLLKDVIAENYYNTKHHRKSIVIDIT